MGKSKRVRRADEKALREFQRQRKIMKIAVIVTGVLFVISVVLVPQLRPQAGWIIFVLLGLYIAAFIGLRMASKCIYCGQPILSRFEQQTHCPHCHRPIRPSVPGKNTLAAK